MDATHRTPTRSRRRLATTFVSLTLAGVLAGGAGGYIVERATAGLHAASPVTAPAFAVPAAAQPHSLNGDSRSGYGHTVAGAAGTDALNADSGSGYTAGPAAGTAVHALNSDAASGYW